MNSAKLDHLVEASGDAAALSDEHLQLCAEFADGLHALAQPLSILRSAIELMALPSSAETDRRRYLEMSLRQIDRATRLFSGMQTLVAAELDPANCVPFDLWGQLVPLIEGREPALRELGINISAEKTSREQPVLGDPERTEQAISALFEIAASLLSPGDGIRLSALQKDDFVEFNVDGVQTHPKLMNSFDRLNLSKAKRNILSQQGRFEFREDPFRVSIALPAGESGARGSDEAVYSASTA
jgi:signal transduction histidine kinase